MASWDQEKKDEKRLWEHILVQTYGTSDLTTRKNLPPDPEGHAFFIAIDQAFTSCDRMQGCVPVDRELVQYIAGWGRDVTRGYDEKGGPIGDGKGGHNHFVRRAFIAFIQTLCRAIKVNQLRYFEDGRVMYGCFVVPQWFIDKYQDEAHEEAAHLNKVWDEDPRLRYIVRETYTRPYWM